MTVPATLRPITSFEFHNVLRKLWPTGLPRRIGLAVSGGADSMALAYLMKQAAEEGVAYKDSLRAFIVDHKARNESSEEAKMVKGNLQSLGIHTEILEIEWGRKVPKNGFEQIAREHRYQLLAKACIKDNIWDLMTAHHANDQAETVFMRMISRSGWSGLGGMQPIAPVPECEQIYDASRLRLFRPFLDFFKYRLRDTCIANEIPWVEDPTNHDPTSSKRNAIRHIFATQADSLPKALQPPKLIEMGNRIRDRMAEEEAAADAILPLFHPSINPKTLVLELRYSRQLLYDHPPIVLGRAISKLITPISPFGESIPMYKLRNSLSLLFPPLKTQRQIEKGADLTLPRATSCNLVWEPEIITSAASRSQGNLYCKIFRQPWRKSERPLVKHIIPPSKDWTDPILWDGRFWISVRNPTHTVVLKQWWAMDDAKSIRLPKYRELATKFRTVPGEVKQSLPVVKIAGLPGQKGGDELVCLPTVKWIVKDCGVEVRCRSRAGYVYL